MFRTILAGAAVSILTILLGPVAVAAHMLRIDEENRRVQQWCMRTWARGVCLAAGVKIRVHDFERAQITGGTVYVSNHTSWFDIFATASSIPRYTFVAKAELRRIPIFGWGAEGAGVVFLERENRKSAFEAYSKVAEKVANGLNVIVYPEGTRGEEYTMRPFKKGPFVLAIAAKAPVIPVVVHGSREVMSRDDWTVKPGVIDIHFLEPVPTDGYDYDHRHELMTMVSRRMADTLAAEHGVAKND